MPTTSEVSTRFSADNSNFRSVAAQTADVADHAGKSILKKLDIRAGTLAIAAAIGFSINSIAEGLARMWTGVSKETEDSLKQLADLSTQVADRTIAANRAKLTTEQQYQLVLKDQERLQRAIDANVFSSAEKQAERARDQLALLDKQAEAEKLLAAFLAEQAAKRETEIKNQQKLAEGLAEIKKNAAEAEKRYQQDTYDLAQKADEEHMQYVRDNAELLTLQAKASQGLTQEEAARLEVLKLIVKQKAIEAEITTLLSLKNRTPEEEARLQFLIRQNSVIKDQIANVGKVKDVTAAIAPEIEKATTANDSFVESMGELFDNATKVITAWKEFKGVITSTGRSDRELSDRELERKIANIQKDIFARQVANPGQADFFIEPQKNNLRQTLAELNLRRNVRQRASTLGEDVAFRQFDGLTEQRFREIIQSGSASTNQLLGDIKDLLKNKGIKTLDVTNP